MIYPLIIKKESVFNKAELISSYQGAKDGTENFSRVKIKDADREITDAYFAEAINILTQLLIKYITPFDVNTCEHNWSCTLDLRNFPPQLIESLSELCHDICASHILVRWYTMLNGNKERIGSQDAATIASSHLEDVISQLKHLLNTRIKPVRLHKHPAW